MRINNHMTLCFAVGLIIAIGLFSTKIPSPKAIPARNLPSFPQAGVIPPPRLWNNTWGGTGVDAAASVWGDGTRVYTAGFTNSFGVGGPDFALVAWDQATGARLWNTTWGGVNIDEATSVWGDGTRIYTAGYTSSYGAGSNDFALVAWDPATHAVLWNTTWGGVYDDEANSVWGDGTRIYTAGLTNSFGAGGYDFALVAWDPATHAVLWNSTWGGGSDDIATSVWGDGARLYTAGYSYSYGAGGNDFALVAWDPATGARLWNATWGGAANDVATSVWGDGARIYTAGYTASYGNGLNDFALVAWDSATHARLWNTTWGGVADDIANSVWSNGGRIYTAGTTFNFGAMSVDTALVVWDAATGNFLWSTMWGGAGDDRAYSVWGDGAHIFSAGYTTSFGAGSYDFSFVAWDIHFSVSHSSDVIYTAGTTGHAINWTISCAITRTSNFTVYRDGINCANGAWTSDQNLSFPIDNLTAGSYIFTLVAGDGFGGQVQDIVNVVVLEAQNTPPSITWSALEWMTAGMLVLLGVIFVTLLLRRQTSNAIDRGRSTRTPDSKVEAPAEFPEDVSPKNTKKGPRKAP